MDEFKSNSGNDDEDIFCDALDELPFHDCSNLDEADQTGSTEQQEDSSLCSEPTLKLLSAMGPRRRRCWSQRLRRETLCNLSNPNSSLTYENSATGEGRRIFAKYLKEIKGENENFDLIGGEIISETVSSSAKDDRAVDSKDSDANSLVRKSRFSQNLRENETDKSETVSNSTNSDFAVDSKDLCANSSWNCREKESEGDRSETASPSLNEENKENVTPIAPNDDDRVIHESSPGFVFVLAGFVIKAIGFQLSLLVNFIAFPLRLLYCTYMFFIDPFQFVSHGMDCVKGRLFNISSIICEKFMSFVIDWLKKHKSIWQLILRFGWGFLWAAYVCVVLVSLLVSAFVISGMVMRKLVDEPIRMTETLIFDYTKNSPVAFVPVISCPVEALGGPSEEKGEVGKAGFPRFIPLNHKLQATVSLVLPESDYNRKLGIFQVRVDLLSANGRTLASLRRPCMLHFKSQLIRLLLTFFKIAPLVAGYSSESQILNLNLRGFTEGATPTACLRVTIEQRAEFGPGAGIPEIYDASLTLESELPLLKKLIWYWKKTLFIWLGMMVFMVELLFSLLCCRPFIMPRGRPRGGSASENNHPAQR